MPTSRGGGYGKKRKLPYREIPPVIGECYVDSIGRQFVVLEINPGAKDGRNVVGIINHQLQQPEPYSCDTKIWNEIWTHKVAPGDPAKMTYP